MEMKEGPGPGQEEEGGERYCSKKSGDVRRGGEKNRRLSQYLECQFR
jgi:hypothetical protein